MAPPWDSSKQAFVRLLLQFLWIPQNAVIGGIIKLIMLWLLLKVMFGELGNCDTRRYLATQVI